MKRGNNARPGIGKKWFLLDNAAKLYPAVSNMRWSSSFRVSAEMTEKVDAARLQKALDNVMPRFPSFKVRMKSGLFWYYLEEMHPSLEVQADEGHPCMPFSLTGNNYLLRVVYYENRISAEFFHSLTDGTGALVFIKTLAAEYVRLGGNAVKFDNGALDPCENPSAGETEDAFLRLDLPKAWRKRSDSPAYHFPATREMPHTLHLTAASMDAEAVKLLAQQYHATVTEYLVSVMMWCALKTQEPDGSAGEDGVSANGKQTAGRKRKKRLRPVRFSVPVNMRAFYPSDTVRNFSSFVNPEFDPALGAYDFQDIIDEVRAYMRFHVNKRLLCADIAFNVGAEKNVAIRVAPLFVKNWVISSVYRRNGDRQVTGTLSNLGKTERPTGTEPFIRRFEFHLGVPGSPTCNCACLTTGNEMRLMFSSNIVETTLPREMLRYLVRQGIRVSVESNREDH